MTKLKFWYKFYCLTKKKIDQLLTHKQYKCTQMSREMKWMKDWCWSVIMCTTECHLNLFIHPTPRNVLRSGSTFNLDCHFPVFNAVVSLSSVCQNFTKWLFLSSETCLSLGKNKPPSGTTWIYENIKISSTKLICVIVKYLK